MSFSIKKTMIGVLLVLSCKNLHAKINNDIKLPELRRPLQALLLPLQAPQPVLPPAQAILPAPQPAPLWQDICSNLYNIAKNQNGWVPFLAGFMAGPLALRLVADRSSSTAEILKAVLCTLICHTAAPLMAGKRPSTDTLPHGVLGNIGLVAGILTLPTLIEIIKKLM